MLKNPISDTAFYCCGARMQDAASEHPICNDHFAQRFMDEHGRAVFAQFANERRSNRSNVTRHRIIDDILRDTLAKNPETQIVLIGAGFDSRAYRLKGGRWFEFDEPQIITYKETCLPTAESPNPLTRIPIIFANDSLPEKLALLSPSIPTIFIIEGVLIYLTQITIQNLLQDLQQMFPQHTLVCDLMNRPFFDQYGRNIHDKLNTMGTPLSPIDQPTETFLANQYKVIDTVSVIGRSITFGPLADLRMRLFNLLLPKLAKGYVVHTFQTPPD